MDKEFNKNGEEGRYLYITKDCSINGTLTEPWSDDSPETADIHTEIKAFFKQGEIVKFSKEFKTEQTTSLYGGTITYDDFPVAIELNNELSTKAEEYLAKKEEYEKLTNIADELAFEIIFPEAFNEKPLRDKNIIAHVKTNLDRIQAAIVCVEKGEVEVEKGEIAVLKQCLKEKDSLNNLYKDIVKNIGQKDLLIESDYETLINFTISHYEEIWKSDEKISYYPDVLDIIAYEPIEFDTFKSLYESTFEERMLNSLNDFTIDEIKDAISDELFEKLSLSNELFHEKVQEIEQHEDGLGIDSGREVQEGKTLEEAEEYGR